jgi:hypothetical protein
MMGLTRRKVLWDATALPLLAGGFGIRAPAETAAQAASDVPPILFVHGNGDRAALWITTLSRMQSNGVPRDRMFVVNFTDPLARGDDHVSRAKPALENRIAVIDLTY